MALVSSTKLIEEVTEKLLQQEAELLKKIDQPQVLEKQLLQWLQRVEAD